MYICICNAVSDRAVKAAVELGAVTLAQVAACTGLGSQCGRCREAAAALIEVHCEHLAHCAETAAA